MIQIMYARLQLFGPSLVFIAAVAADAAAGALAAHPGSQMLWYINLEWFGFFGRAWEMLPQYLSVPWIMVWLSLPALVIAWRGFLAQKRLVLAIGSNLSLIHMIVLGCLSSELNYSPQAASLQYVHMPTGPNLAVLLLLCVAAFVSFAISHIVYVRTIFQRA